VNSLVQDNSASHFDGGVSGFYATLVFQGSVLTGNTAGDVGGNMGCDFCTITINNSTFSDGVADRAGGIYIALSTLSANRCALVGNQATSLQGGALFNDRSISKLVACTVGNNFSGWNGGGIYNEGFGSDVAELDLTNVTVAGNVALAGGGVYNVGGTVNMVNSIDAKNANLFGQPSDCFGPIASAGYNIVGILTDCQMTGGTHEMLGDPGIGQLIASSAPAKAYFPLLAESRAIGSADQSQCPRVDQLGRKRKACGRGAVEYQPSYE
jgi:hypothetical protein